jgi:hypothetical protein
MKFFPGPIIEEKNRLRPCCLWPTGQQFSFDMTALLREGLLKMLIDRIMDVAKLPMQTEELDHVI